MLTALWKWLGDDRADDLIEYALLAATVGIGSAAALSVFPGVMKAVYESWDSATESISQPPDP